MLLKAKLTNQLKIEAEKQNVKIEMFLRNISVNGEKRGCSGHVVNTETGSCVYLTTEKSCLSSLADKSMYRLALSIKDYSSNTLRNGYNRWAEDRYLPSAVISLLKREKGEER
jgi:hypothetical protein